MHRHFIPSVLACVGILLAGCPKTTTPSKSTSTDGGSAPKDAGNTSTSDSGLNRDGCVHAGCSSQLCVEASAGGMATTCEFRPEYACYQRAVCERLADDACGFTKSEALATCLEDANGNDGGSTEGKLVWRETCGAPVCRTPAEDDPTVDNCSTEMKEGAACSTPDVVCDLVNECATKLKCSTEDPTQGGMCPKSRARFKRDIAYLSGQERARIYEDLLAIPLASYEYKEDSAGASPQLGFILEDVEPSPATRGDRVNLYGYLSMAVNAVQLQAKQIEALQREVAALRAQTESSRDRCEP